MRQLRMRLAVPLLLLKENSVEREPVKTASNLERSHSRRRRYLECS
jgi:hypothetical protein